jgi:hypothetical protein
MSGSRRCLPIAAAGIDVGGVTFARPGKGFVLIDASGGANQVPSDAEEEGSERSNAGTPPRAPRRESLPIGLLGRPMNAKPARPEGAASREARDRVRHRRRTASPQSQPETAEFGLAPTASSVHLHVKRKVTCHASLPDLCALDYCHAAP